MPEKAKPATAPSVQPSRGFLSRMFGSDEFTPEQQQGIDIARREMPDMAPVQPYGFFSRMMSPDLMGYVSGGKNIYLNPRANVGQSPQDIADTLTHEQEHVRQKQASGYGPTMQALMGMFNRQPAYHQRPEEMAAYQAEKMRRFRMGRPQSPVPSFETGEFYTPKDINLPVEKPRNPLPQYSGPVTMK